MISLKEGEHLVKLARETITSFFSKQILVNKKHSNTKRGIFVTIHMYPSKQLRGCIGIIEPIYNIEEGIAHVAKAAAFEDPRFPPLEKEELKNIILEISILSKPELIKVMHPQDYFKEIKIPGDGLIVHYNNSSGLLLPQVPVEFDWNQEEFLNYTCKKACLPPDTWRKPNCSVYKFQVQIFSEEKPNGSIIEKHL